MSNNRILLLTISFWGLSLLGFSQKEFAVGINPHFGFVIPHHTSVVNLIQGHSKGLEINIEWKTDGLKEWHHHYKSPRIGIDFFYNNLGNDLQLGSHFNAIAYTAFCLDKKFRHRLKTGVGIGYSTAIWDLYNNTKATLLSSHLNTAIQIQYAYYLPISSTLTINTGVRVNHFSNGSFKLPNKGTNNASIFLGLQWNNYSIKPTTLPTEFSPQKTKLKSISYTLLGSFGLKQISIADSKKYFVYTLSSLIERRNSPRTSWGAGLDLFYNMGLKNLLEIPDPAFSPLQLGAVISYTKHLDPLEIKIMIGGYLIDNYKNNGIIYNRFGLRYWINKSLVMGLTLKTHYARADHIELGIGYRIGNN